MRYVVVKNENASREIAIWTKSQHRVMVKNPGITRECSHRDYLRKNNIPFENVTSIGLVYYNPKTDQMEVSVLPWDTPAPEEDDFLIRKATVDFCKKNTDLTDEILADWNEYKAWQKRAQESMAARK